MECSPRRMEIQRGEPAKISIQRGKTRPTSKVETPLDLLSYGLNSRRLSIFWPIIQVDILVHLLDFCIDILSIKQAVDIGQFSH
jgi:hypothetical protein